MAKDEFEYEFRMVGLKIAYYRKARNLTQEQLAELMGTSASYIGSIESKMHKPISFGHSSELLNVWIYLRISYLSSRTAPVA